MPRKCKRTEVNDEVPDKSSEAAVLSLGIQICIFSLECLSYMFGGPDGKTEWRYCFAPWNGRRWNTCSHGQAQIWFLPIIGNRRPRPKSKEKKALKTVQRPPTEANAARRVCVLNSSVTVKPLPLGEIPQPGYRTAIISTLESPIPFCGIGSVYIKGRKFSHRVDWQRSRSGTTFLLYTSWPSDIS